MHKLGILAAVLLLTGCRGEPTPRDYQNQPPAMTHPPKKASETPTAHGMPGPSPEPSKGVEGKSTDTNPPTRQSAPANDTVTTTVTTATTATHT